MLVIRDAQMDVLRASMFRTFVAASTAELRKNFSSAAQTVGNLEAFVEAGIARAHALGLRQRDNIRRFLEYLLILGPQFPDTPPWAKAVFARKGIHETARMDLLDSYLVLHGYGAHRDQTTQ
jgi:hypothetical protein